MIKNILFDLGGVLVDLDVHASIRKMAELLPNTDEAPITWKDLIGGGETKLVQQYQTGKITTDDFVQTILAACRPTTTREQIVDAWFAMLRTIPEQRLAMIRRLKEAGLHIYILSNINELHVDWVKQHYPELLALCDKAFFSNEIQIAKPDLAAYEYVLSHADIKADETLYIDDLGANITAGQAAGFVSIQAIGDEWLTHTEKLL